MISLYNVLCKLLIGNKIFNRELKIKRSPLRAGSSPAFGTTSKFKALRVFRKAFLLSNFEYINF